MKDKAYVLSTKDWGLLIYCIATYTPTDEVGPEMRDWIENGDLELAVRYGQSRKLAAAYDEIRAAIKGEPQVVRSEGGSWKLGDGESALRVNYRWAKNEG